MLHITHSLVRDTQGNHFGKKSRAAFLRLFQHKYVACE